MSSFVKNPLQAAERIEAIFGDDLHAMRVLSLTNSVVGTLDAAVLSIHAIGRGYAHVANKSDKHGVKQTDRMLSNKGIDIWFAATNDVLRDSGTSGRGEYLNSRA